MDQKWSECPRYLAQIPLTDVILRLASAFVPRQLSSRTAKLAFRVRARAEQQDEYLSQSVFPSMLYLFTRDFSPHYRSSHRNHLVRGRNRNRLSGVPRCRRLCEIWSLSSCATLSVLAARGKFTIPTGFTSTS